MISSPHGDEPPEKQAWGTCALKGWQCRAAFVCYRNDPPSRRASLLSAFLTTQKVADSLAVFGIPALEQTDKWLSGSICTALIGSRHVVEFGAPFVNMAAGGQSGDLERFLALILNRRLALVSQDRRGEQASSEEDGESYLNNLNVIIPNTTEEHWRHA